MTLQRRVRLADPHVPQGFAVATTVLADKIIQRYEDLLGALQALNERLAGRVPFPEDFLPIQAPAEAFARAAYNTRM